MKYLALLLLIISTSVESCPNFSIEQLHVLQYSYDRGVKNNIPLVLATIAYKESSAGKFLVNSATGDYGIYQGNYKTVCSQANVKGRSCSREIERVINDKHVASDHAIETLLWWENYYHYHPNQEEMMIRSYNAGFSAKSKDADLYWEQFRKRFIELQQCVRFK